MTDKLFITFFFKIPFKFYKLLYNFLEIYKWLAFLQLFLYHDKTIPFSKKKRKEKKKKELDERNSNKKPTT